MQAIQTKFFGPTNVSGSRYKATASAGSVILHADHALNPEQNHKAAAEALVAKFHWNEHKGYEGLIGGCLADGSYVWVLVESMAVR